MPIYAYQCESCGHHLDALQKMSDAPLSVCPQCGKPQLRKQLTAAGFQLKGSGWYVTDFKGGSGATKAKAADGDTVASDKPAEKADASTSADSKPAAASSAAPAASTATTPSATKTVASAAAPAASAPSSSTP